MAAARNSTPVFATRAIYTPQRIPQYRSNPFIEALPPTLDEDEWLEALFCVPEFDIEQRDWSRPERIQLIAQLASFMVPMDRHIRLGLHLDALMRQGYVGRAPRTVESQQIYTKLYEQQKAGKTFDTSAVQLSAQLSGAWIGLPGMGKTTTLRRMLARNPPVIFHPEHHIFQVPYLHIEMPYNGSSVTGLAKSIFRKLDLLLPDANYGKQYGNPRSGTETLMNDASRVLHMHAVGLLVVDEMQNLENSPKNREALMTLLVSASNELGVPILFVGTNKAEGLLQMDFRQARRSTGLASSYWGAYQRGSADEPGEWDDFLSVLWEFQWVKNPTPLSPHLSNLMFHHTQGVADVAIKLFAIAQARAIFDRSETLTGALIDSVAQNEMARVQPMIEAIRRNDVRALAAYRDIAPIGLDEMLADVATKFSGRKVRGASITGASPEFVPMVMGVLTKMGFEQQNAATLAEKVSDSETALEGVQMALKHATSGRPVKSKKGPKEEKPVSYPPGDLRNAGLPGNGGETVVERMRKLGMLADVDAILTV